MQNKTPESGNIRTEPAIQRLLSRIPLKVADEFSDIQLIHLKTALGSRDWGRHRIDCRGTFAIPLSRWRYYYVFLWGRNRRDLSAREKRTSAFLTAVCLLLFLIFCTALGLLSLYLIKSLIGVDIFPNFSLGIWH